MSAGCLVPVHNVSRSQSTAIAAFANAGRRDSPASSADGSIKLKVMETAQILTPEPAAARATALVVSAGTFSGKLEKPGTHVQFHCVQVSPCAAIASKTSSMLDLRNVLAKIPSSKTSSGVKSICILFPSMVHLVFNFMMLRPRERGVAV